MGTGIRRRWRIVTNTVVPAAGQSWVVRTPGQTWWRVISVVARLATSAVAGNRFVILSADDGESTFWKQEISRAHIEGQTIDYCAHTGAIVNGTNSFNLGIPLPAGGLLLRSGDRLVSDVRGIGVADQWSNIRLYVEEVPSGPPYFGDQGMIVPRELSEFYYA